MKARRLAAACIVASAACGGTAPPRDPAPGAAPPPVVMALRAPPRSSAPPNGDDVPPSDASAAASGPHGRIEPVLVQRTVRANFSAFRVCYESGLKRDAHLEGRVTTKFVIERDGTTSAAQAVAKDTDLPDPLVVACVVDGFRPLVFPKPEGGAVTVVYPIIFHPGD